MQVIIPDHLKDDDDLKRAFQWISDELRYDPKQNVDKLIEEAINRFDLTLMEAESIFIMYADISKRPKPTYPWTNFGL
jgi:hypothetical protein